MSATNSDEFTLKKALIEIDHMRAETSKFTAEQRKLIAEASKFDVERRLYPIAVLSALIGGGVVAIISHFWR